MRFSFLTVNYNMGPLVKNLAKAIAQQLPDPASYEMIVADNSTDPAFRLNLEAFPPGSPIQIIPVAANESYVTVLNRILPLAKGERVVLMHPDVEAPEGCYQTLATFLDNNPKAGVVSPELTEPTPQQRGIFLHFPAVSTELRKCFNKLPQVLLRRKLFREDVFWDRKSETRTDMVSGIFMMFRREAIQGIGTINTRLVSYYYNDYLCARAGQLGWTCHYTPQTNIVHLGRYTPKELYSNQQLMEYKKDSAPADARTRADYLTFLSLFYPLWSRFTLRTLALFEDSFDLLLQLRRPKQRKERINHLWRTILVDLGKNPA
jgi:GT2 family glycosyltransferase